jgi:CelD/BcsL family acetyltransferase involved in cellulose biosynthesis
MIRTQNRKPARSEKQLAAVRVLSVHSAGSERPELIQGTLAGARCLFSDPPMSSPENNPPPTPTPWTLRVRAARPEDAESWDRFVDAHPEGRYCHLWGYKRALERAYGYRCVYLNFQEGENLIGVFPSIKVKRHRGWLISQPFNEYGGPLIHDLSPDQHRDLTRHLVQAAQEEDCNAIEVRGGIGCEQIAKDAGWVKQPLHSYALLNLGDSDQIWRRSLTNEARKGVNKARKSGLTAEIRKGAAAVQDPFYDLYLVSMKRLGVPPHSFRFFAEFARGIGERLVAAWVLREAQPVAILLGATTGRRVHIFVIASAPEAWPMRPSDLAHWELIHWACREGFQVFDFGSARYAGQIQFKKKWGVTLHDYSFYLIGPPGAMGKLKSETVRTSSRSMEAMATLWRWAVPLPLTRILGPPIRKYLTK